MTKGTKQEQMNEVLISSLLKTLSSYPNQQEAMIKLEEAISTLGKVSNMQNKQLDELFTLYDQGQESVEEEIVEIARRSEPLGVVYKSHGAYIVDSNKVTQVGVASLPDFDDSYINVFRRGIDDLAREYQTTQDNITKGNLIYSIQEKVNILNKVNRETVVDPRCYSEPWNVSESCYDSEKIFAQFLVEKDIDEKGAYTRLIYVGNTEAIGGNSFIGVAPKAMAQGQQDFLYNNLDIIREGMNKINKT